MTLQCVDWGMRLTWCREPSHHKLLGRSVASGLKRTPCIQRQRNDDSLPPDEPMCFRGFCSERDANSATVAMLRKPLR